MFRQVIMRNSQKGTLSWLIVALITAVFGVWVWESARSDRAARNLPPAERIALYERTLETLQTTCAHADDVELVKFCRQQAEFVLRLRECDDACHELARVHLAPARR